MSVLDSIGKEDEVVCVDDASQISPLKADSFAELSDPRIRVLHCERNGGAGAARNEALKIASGRFVAFVDSDDEVVPGTYAKCLHAIECSRSDIALFGVRVVWVHDGLMKVDIPRVADYGELGPVDVKSIFDECLFEYPVNKIYRRSFLDEHRIRFNPGVCPGEDTAFNLECLIAKPRVCSINELGYIYYRMEGTSLSRAYPDLRRTLEYRTALWRRYKDLTRGAREVLGSLGEFDESAIAHAEWQNMWRRGATASLVDRWRARPSVSEFVRTMIRTVLRRCFYFRPIRRRHIKRIFPNCVEWKMS